MRAGCGWLLKVCREWATERCLESAVEGCGGRL